MIRFLSKAGQIFLRSDVKYGSVKEVTGGHGEPFNVHKDLGIVTRI